MAIIKDKLEAADKAAKAQQRQDLRKAINDALLEKKEGELKGKSIEDLEKQLAELDKQEDE